MRANPSRTQLAAFGLLAAVITALVYLPSVGNGFVEWDDHVYVYENKGLVLEGFEFCQVGGNLCRELELAPVDAPYLRGRVQPLGAEPVGLPPRQRPFSRSQHLPCLSPGLDCFQVSPERRRGVQRHRSARRGFHGRLCLRHTPAARRVCLLGLREKGRVERLFLPA